MIGVVLWSDNKDRKAVVWCEDQGDLAFLSGRDGALCNDEFFEIGDVLEFDLTLERSCRRASNATLLQQGAGSAAIDELRTVFAPEPEAHTGAQIIPFRSDGPHRQGDRGRRQPERARRNA